MRDNLSISVSKFQFWTLSLYFLTAVLTNYRDGVEAYNLLSRTGFFKFVVAVKTEAGVCTGTIVNKDWILTAAHCLYQHEAIVADDGVTVMAGVIDWQHPQKDTGQFRTSAELKVHPRFWYDRLAKFDIALVRVNDSFVFNDFVGKINISGEPWSTTKEEPDNCMSIGYGGYHGNISPVNFLKVWNVTAAYGPSNCPCSRRFQYKRLVCAKNADYAKLCSGDDGGPLVCGNAVRGIAHMVRNWYICNENPQYPLNNCDGSPERGLSIYMLLCPFNTWLHGIVDDIPPTPETCGASVMSRCTSVLVFMLLFYLICNKICL